MQHTHQTYNPGRGGSTTMCSQLAHNENVITEHFAARTRVRSDPNLKSET
jgi:hypothetical protein